MNHSAIANAIRSRFKTLVADTKSLPTQYDNQAFTPTSGTAWARVTVLFGESAQVSFGGPLGRRSRTVGVLMVQVFSPVDKGDGDLLTLAGEIATAFKGVTDTGVHFRIPSVRRAGRSDAEYQVNVECPFYADDLG